uniref:Zn(2)-C6 fungal-type domain-containing protein n=2 Tax=Moniliophthora roreri TaxID=221103 RepID=A0A0W0FVS4_MONRR
MSFIDSQQYGDLGVAFKAYDCNYRGADISRVSEQALVDGHHPFDEHSRKQYPHSLHPHPCGAVYPIDDHFGPPVENYPNSSNYHGWSSYSSNLHYEHPSVQWADHHSPYSISPSLNHMKLNPQALHHVQQSNPLQLTPGSGVLPGSSHRLAFAGSLDPATGIFYRAPEHPRLRTAQACEKCRTRKAKCSGEHPSCKRCITRGLICQYAKEGRVRGPNKPKPRPRIPTTPPPSNPTSMLHGDVYSGPPASMIAPSSTSLSASPPISSSSPSAHSDPSPPASGLVLDYPQPSRNPSLGESMSNETRPPHLQLQSMSNLYRLQNSLQKGSIGAGYTDFPKHPIQCPAMDSSIEPHPLSDTPRDMSHESNHYCYAYPSLAQAMSHAGQAEGEHDRSSDSK